MTTFSISAPYPEGAILALATRMTTSGDLACYYAPSRSVNGLFAKALGALPSTSTRRVAQRLLRGTAHAISPFCEVGGGIEIRRLLGSQLTRRTGHVFWSFDELKRDFDKRVARKLGHSDVFIGLPGASLDSFRSVSSRTMRVLHEVDAPPHAHNGALLAHYTRREVQRELLPQRISDVVEEEIREADVVLSPSNVVSRQLRELVSDIRIVQVAYGVDLERFRFPSTSVSARGSGRRPHAVYVGQISRRKGIPFLVAAASTLNIDVSLVGPMVDPTVLEKAPVNVSYLGVLPHEQLNDKLGTADVFVFPSIEENFGLALIEAVASGLPVITTTAVGSAELLDSRDVCLVPPGDAAALRTALSNVRPQPEEERRERASRVRDPESNVVSWDTYFERVKDGLLSNMVSQHEDRLPKVEQSDGGLL